MSAAGGSQGDVLVFLGTGARLGRGGEVEHIETHASHVFLAGDRVFKLKKALKLPYLDYSTAALRENACRREVALNAATAPDLYLGVRRITRRKDGGLEFDGDGAPVDAVVEMRRFDQSALFDRLAAAGALTPELMTAAANAIAAHHRHAPIIASGGGGENIAAVLAINAEAFAGSTVFSQEEAGGLSRRLSERLERHRALLDRRAEAGCVRRCHGDLHLRNICLIDGRPVLFDGIEFNLSIATVDILYDLAFLLMDLWRRDLRGLANLTANRYFDAAGTEEGYGLIAFFMAIRAQVRAHVAATQAGQAESGARERLAGEARGYFALAGQLLDMQEPRLFAIGGLSGSGKSTVAARLAPLIGAAPGARILESDRIRKALHGIDAEARLPDEAYRPAVSERVYDEIALRAAAVLGEGGTVVANAVYDLASSRHLIESAARPSGAHFTGIWLDADAQLLRQRVAARRGGTSDAGIAVLETQLSQLSAPVEWRHVDAAGTPDAVAAAIIALADS